MDSAERFLRYLLTERRYSEHTVAAYRRDIRQFRSYAERFEMIAPFTASDVRSWLASLAEEGLSNRSINRKLAALRSWFAFEERQPGGQPNPAIHLQPPKLSKRLPDFVPADDMQRLMDFLQHSELRERLVIELLYATGMRVSELCRLRRADVDHGAAQIKVLGKGNKQRLLPLAPKWLKTLDAYLNERNDDLDALVLTASGKPIYPRAVQRLVSKWLKTFSHVEKCSPHVLRHTFATALLNNGADLNAIKELLGHASLAATQVYTHNSIDQLKQVYGQAHPRGDSPD